MRVTIGVLLGLFSLSSAMYYMKHGPFAPKDIATFDIDLSREHSFVAKVDFQTHNGHAKGDDKSGNYKFSLISPSLKPRDYEKNELWKVISERYHNKEPSGEVLFEWRFSEGEAFSQKCGLGFQGHFGFGDGYDLCSLWLPARSKREVTEVKVTVLKADPFLAENLESPKIWIYRGGGK